MTQTQKTNLKTPRKSRWYHGAFIAFEIVFVAVLALGVLLAYGAWSIHKTPFDIGFAKPYLQAQLSYPERGITTKLDDVSLHWPDLKGPILVGLGGVGLYDSQGREILNINDAALGLSRLRLMVGQIAPTALIVKDVKVHVSRGADNKFAFGFLGQNITDTTNIDDAPAAGDKHNEIMTHIMGFIADIDTAKDDVTADNSPLAHLKFLKLDAARLSIDDDVLNAEWHIPRFDITAMRTKNGLRADFDIHMVENAAHPHMRGFVKFDRKSFETDAGLDLSNVNIADIGLKLPNIMALKGQKGTLNGAVNLRADRAFTLIDGRADLRLNNGVFNMPDTLQAPLNVEDVTFKANFLRGDGGVYVANVEAISADLGGVIVTVAGRGNFTANNFDIPLQISVPNISQDTLKSLWIKGIENEPITQWATRKISGGMFTNLQTDFRIVGQKSNKWDIDARDINLDFAFADTTIAFLDRFSAAKNVRGTGRLNHKTDALRINIEDADIQGLKVKDGVVTLSDVMAVGKDSAKITLPVTSSLSNVFKFITQERIGVNHGFDEKNIKGSAAFTVGIDMSTLKDVTFNDIAFNVSGGGRGAALPNVIKGLDLTDMTYKVDLKDNVLNVTGKGALNGRTADITYSRALEMGGGAKKPYKTKITAALTGDMALLKDIGADIGEYIDGSFPVSVVYTQARSGEAVARVEADTRAATVKIAPFGYSRSGDADSRIDLTVHLKNDHIDYIDALSVRAPDLEIKDGVVKFTRVDNISKFLSLKSPHVMLGQSNGAASLIKTPVGSLDFDFNGDVFDLRPFLDKSDVARSAENPPIKINIAAKQLLTNESHAVSQGKITADMDEQGRFNRLSVDAVVGRGPLTLRYAPNAAGQRVFDLNAADAGAALNVFGVYDKVRDGGLMIHGQSQSDAAGDRTIRGAAHMTNFRVRKTPVLGRLLSAMSLPGVVQLVDGDGLIFEKMATDFTWQYRPEGSLITMKDGRTSGNSLGLTFDGTIDNAAHRTNVKGTIIPLSGLNKTISSIPIIGDILTGGSGSVFAATYTIKGKTSDPSVSVNPLSVLAPGIVRRVLFEGEAQ